MLGPAITSRLPVNDKLKLNRYHVIFMGSMVGISMLHNVQTRRPPNASILKHILFGTAGYFMGREATNFVDERRRMRLLILEDYISKHPEDFPITEPKKYGDVLMPWFPTR